MSDFIVRLELELPKEVENRIAGAIQAAVMAELGKVDLRDKIHASQLAYIPRKEWLGKWLRVAANVHDVRAFDKTKLVVGEQELR